MIAGECAAATHERFRITPARRPTAWILAVCALGESSVVCVAGELSQVVGSCASVGRVTGRCLWAMHDQAPNAPDAPNAQPSALDQSEQPLSFETTRSLFYHHELKGSVLIVRPAGPNLGQREAAILNSEVGTMIASLGPRIRTLLLDLSDVQAMASFGLGVCIELRNAAHARGARTLVFGLNDELAALFRLMKVERLYTIVRSTKELSKALAA